MILWEESDWIGLSAGCGCCLWCAVQPACAVCVAVHTCIFLEDYFNVTFVSKFGFSKHSNAQTEKKKCLNASSDRSASHLCQQSAFQNPKICINGTFRQPCNKIVKGAPLSPDVKMLVTLFF